MGVKSLYPFAYELYFVIAFGHGYVKTLIRQWGSQQGQPIAPSRRDGRHNFLCMRQDQIKRDTRGLGENGDFTLAMVETETDLRKATLQLPQVIQRLF